MRDGVSGYLFCFYRIYNNTEAGLAHNLNSGQKYVREHVDPKVVAESGLSLDVLFTAADIKRFISIIGRGSPSQVQENDGLGLERHV